MSSTSRFSPEAPADYEQLFDDYFEFVRLMVLRAGIRQDDCEDVAADILLRFYERDFLSVYDPTMVFETPRGRRTAKFTTFLGGFVSRYVMAARDKQNTYARKVPERLDAPAGEGRTFLEVLDEDMTSSHSDPTAEEGMASRATAEALEESSRSIALARAHLATIPVRGSRDLLRTYDMCRHQVRTTGKISRAEIAAELGISVTAVGAIFRDLRAALAEAGHAPSPEAAEAALVRAGKA